MILINKMSLIIMYLKTFTLILKTDKKVEQSATFLRGFVANKFKEYSILHHHTNGNKYVYLYPKIQYKIINGMPMILGIEDGAEILRKLYGEINELTLGNQNYKIIEKQIIEKEQEFSENKNMQQYIFITPWLALNEKNYANYKQMDKKYQILQLHKILIGNILSISKTFEYVVLNELKVKTNIKPEIIRYKGLFMASFHGEFQVNFQIPDYFGIGKAVSRGFGTVMQIRK